MTCVSRHLIAAPTQDVISIEDAKLALRVTSINYDDLIEALVKAAVAKLDPAYGGWLGRALRPQTWELRMPAFPSGPIELPYPPLISVDSVKYFDGDGVDTTMMFGVDYRVFGGGGRNSRIVPAYNGTWPSDVRCDDESVRVRFICGYDESEDTFPPAVRQAILLAVRGLWSLAERNLYLRAKEIPGVASYDWVVSETAGLIINQAVEGLLAEQRVIE